MMDSMSLMLSTAWTRWPHPLSLREPWVSTILLFLHVQLGQTWLILFSYQLAALKLTSPSKEHLEEHYKDLAGKPFYPGLISCEYSPSRGKLNVY